MSYFELLFLGGAIYLAGLVTGIIIQAARTLGQGRNADEGASPIE
jgi:hypothetical protein